MSNVCRRERSSPMIHRERSLRPFTVASLVGIALVLAAFTAAAQTPIPTAGTQSTPAATAAATKVATVVATAVTTTGGSTSTTTTTTSTGTNWTPILIVVLIIVVIILAVGLAVRRPWISDVP
jgi:hypothetical protein